jgi:hypothetical protein
VCLQPQGTTTTVKAFLKDNFNYEYDRLYICVVVLLAYLAIFWCAIVWLPPQIRRPNVFMAAPSGCVSNACSSLRVDQECLTK